MSRPDRPPDWPPPFPELTEALERRVERATAERNGRDATPGPPPPRRRPPRIYALVAAVLLLAAGLAVGIVTRPDGPDGVVVRVGPAGPRTTGPPAIAPEPAVLATGPDPCRAPSVPAGLAGYVLDGDLSRRPFGVAVPADDVDANQAVLVPVLGGGDDWAAQAARDGLWRLAERGAVAVAYVDGLAAGAGGLAAVVPALRSGVCFQSVVTVGEGAGAGAAAEAHCTDQADAALASVALVLVDPRGDGPATCDRFPRRVVLVTVDGPDDPVVDTWAERNGCAPPGPGDGAVVELAGCEADVTVVTIPAGGDPWEVVVDGVPLAELVVRLALPSLALDD